MRSIVSDGLREVYRRFLGKLDSVQTVRVIDTGEIVPDLSRGQMYTYQLRVYNVSRSSPINNARAKLHLWDDAIWFRADVRTGLTWAPDKGTVTINRGDHEWLNLATVRLPDEGELWGRMPVAELVFPTEAGVLNPATVEITRQGAEDGSLQNSVSVKRESLPVLEGLPLFGFDNIRVTSSNRPVSRYDLSINQMDDSVRVSVTPNRKGRTAKVVEWVFGLYNEGLGASVSLDGLGE